MQDSPANQPKQPPVRWWSHPRTLLRHILMLDDTPHSIALGTAVGVFVGMTPTVGIQMILVVVLSFLTRRVFRFNVIAALIAIYISNPVTTVPIYWFDYTVGSLFFEGDNIKREEFAQLLVYHSFTEWWNHISTLFVRIGAPLLVGAAVVATPCGVVTYFLMRWLLLRFHRRKVHSHKRTGSPAVEESRELRVES